jgi:hypothetical protein
MNASRTDDPAEQPQASTGEAAVAAVGAAGGAVGGFMAAAPLFGLAAGILTSVGGAIALAGLAWIAARSARNDKS